MWGIDYGQCSPSEKKLVSYNFWNMDLDEMIEKFGE